VPTPGLTAILADRLHQSLQQTQSVQTARFGLDGCAPGRRVETSERLGMSMGRGRRLEQRGLAKLAQSAAPPAGSQ
jgi:hypothetical protein